MVYFVWFVISCFFCVALWISYSLIFAILYNRRHHNDDEE